MPVEPLEGPGFEPLISKASKCDSFEGKGPLKEYSILIWKRRRVASHARGSSAGGRRRGPIRAVRCGRAFSGDSLGQMKRRGQRLTDGIAQQSRRAPGYHATLIAACVRGRPRGRGAQLSVIAKSTAFNAVDFGPRLRLRPLW